MTDIDGPLLSYLILAPFVIPERHLSPQDLDSGRCPTEVATPMSRKAKIYANSDIMVLHLQGSSGGWKNVIINGTGATPNDVRGDYVFLAGNVKLGR